MGSYEATNVVLARIKHLEPENATKIMGYLLMNLEENELVRVACSSDTVLHSLILRAKTQLGFSSNSSSTPSTPSSPSPLNPIARPSSSNPFSQSSPRMVNNGFDFNRNPASPSSHGWPLSGFPNNPIGPKCSPSLPFETICAGSAPVPYFSCRMNADGNTVGESVDEQQMNGYFSFLNEVSRSEDLVDPQLEFAYGAQNWSPGNVDVPFHRRSFSASEVCMGSEEGPTEIGLRPCLYFSRGFCKNGSNCKFSHGGFCDAVDAYGVIVGSPTKFEVFDQREEFLRLKTAQQQKLASMSPSSYEKYLHFLLQQQNDPPQRAATAAALMMRQREEFYRRCREERPEFLAMMSAEKPNSASRQIYLTFPAESTFKDEDVSEYFSKFGPVQDVRIPYQQKRMFGFVTFVFPETVKLILSKGNPHFICDSRVLVKPYKEKGKVPDKRQQHQQQQLEIGEFSPCLSPSEFDSKEPFDLQLGPRMFYNPQEILLRRKLEEQELQQAIEFQGTRLMNLQLPNFKNNQISHDQCSLSGGAAFPLEQQLQNHINNAAASSDIIKEDITGYSGSPASPISLPTAEKLPPQKDVKPADLSDNGSGKFKDSSNAEVFDLSNSVEQVLPDILFASPTKAAEENLSDFPVLALLNESTVSSTTSSCENKLEQPATSSDMASH